MAAHEQHPQPPAASTTATNQGTGAAHTADSAHATGSANSADGSAHTDGSVQITDGSTHPTSPTAATSSPHGTGNNDRAQQLEWCEAFAVAATIPSFARPTPKELDTLAAACGHPRQLRLLLEAFARHASTLPSNSRHADTLPNDSSHLPQRDSLPAAAQPSELPYAFLCDFVDDSAHDLREWINALTVFDDWLHEHNHPPQPLTMLLPYLSCSAEAQASSPMPLPLPHILADMLELYGYSGSSGS